MLISYYFQCYDSYQSCYLCVETQVLRIDSQVTGRGVSLLSVRSFFWLDGVLRRGRKGETQWFVIQPIIGMFTAR